VDADARQGKIIPHQPNWPTRTETCRNTSQSANNDRAGPAGFIGMKLVYVKDKKEFKIKNRAGKSKD